MPVLDDDGSPLNYAYERTEDNIASLRVDLTRYPDPEEAADRLLTACDELAGMFVRPGENPMSEQIPSIGRVVHYVLNEGRNIGDHRPAQIVRVWGVKPDSLVNLQVLTDSNPEGNSNDCLPQVLWKTSVSFDPTGERPQTWHWPERV